MLMTHFDLAKRFEEKYAQPEVPEEEQNPEKEEVLEEQKSCYVRKGPPKNSKMIFAVQSKQKPAYMLTSACFLPRFYHFI